LKSSPLGQDQFFSFAAKKDEEEEKQAPKKGERPRIRRRRVLQQKNAYKVRSYEAQENHSITDWSKPNPRKAHESGNQKKKRQNPTKKSREENIPLISTSKFE